MKLTRLKALTLTLLFTLASGFNAANAALITHNGYTLDTDTDIVTGGGLEWLQWDVTTGESINSALAANGQFDSNDYGTGWTLATNVQMAVLFDAFSFNSTTDESQLVETFSPYVSDTDETNMDLFIRLFGTTEAEEGGFYGTGFDALRYASAIYGSDKDGDALYKSASIRSDYILNVPFNNIVLPAVAFAKLVPDFFSESDIDTVYGVALVRTTTVPEPSTVIILTLGLLGLGLRRSVRV